MNMMKRIFSGNEAWMCLRWTVALSVLLLFPVINNVKAQPSWGKKAVKSVFTLKTFAADGSLMGSSNGFFISEKGEAVSAYQPFKGAQKAVVIDADGKEWAVDCMLGASETYDVAKFLVTVKKAQPLVVAAAAKQGDALWLLPYRDVKRMVNARVSRVEQFGGGYDYLTLSLPAQEQGVGTPLLNDEGQVVALLQQSVSPKDTVSYAVAARYADSLRITGLSINDPVLRATGIRKALPSDLSQAQLTLYVGASSLDSVAYVQLIEDFIGQFPSAPDGYQYRANMALAANRFDDARSDMEQAISVAAQKDDAHYNYSRLILQKELYKQALPYEPWSLALALKEAEEAYRINPLPIYRYQQAQVHFAEKNYEQSSDIFAELLQSSLRSAELFYEASRCRALLADSIGQLALLDSAMAQFSRPYLKEAAPYLLARAQTRMSMEKYRDAVQDLNDYESLMRSQVNANFYYLRHQADLGGRLFQQALNDINRAIEMQPSEPLYLAEKAALEVRVGLYAEAGETATQLIQLAPNQSDGYLFLGLSQCLQGQKQQGLEQLQKALDMGDPQAQEMIDKYGK